MPKLGELGFKVGPFLYLVEMSVFDSDPRQWLKQQVFKQKKSEPDVRTQLLEVRHMSRQKFFYLGPPNSLANQHLRTCVASPLFVM